MPWVRVLLLSVLLLPFQAQATWLKVKTTGGCFFYTWAAPKDKEQAIATLKTLRFTWSGNCTADQPAQGQGLLRGNFTDESHGKMWSESRGMLVEGAWDGEAQILMFHQQGTQIEPLGKAKTRYTMGCTMGVDGNPMEQCVPRTKKSTAAK